MINAVGSKYSTPYSVQNKGVAVAEPDSVCVDAKGSGRRGQLVDGVVV